MGGLLTKGVGKVKGTTRGPTAAAPTPGPMEQGKECLWDPKGVLAIGKDPLPALGPQQKAAASEEMQRSEERAGETGGCQGRIQT